MILKMFSIRDQKAETFNSPFFQPTHGEAERSFRQMVADQKTIVNKYPEDFDLYFVGEYNTNKGTFKTIDTPQHLLKAVSFINAALDKKEPVKSTEC